MSAAANRVKITAVFTCLVLIFVAAQFQPLHGAPPAGSRKNISFKTAYFMVTYPLDDQEAASWVLKTARYLDPAFESALNVVGVDARPFQGGKRGHVNIMIYTDPSEARSGYFNGKDLGAVHINTAKQKTPEAWGSIIAHETAHLLFECYTNSSEWRAGSGDLHMRNYSGMLSESPAYYAGSVVWFQRIGTPKEIVTRDRVKRELAKRIGPDNPLLNWHDCGRIYKVNSKFGADDESSKPLRQAWWQFHAIGYLLTEGLVDRPSPKVRKLLTVLRETSALKSEDFATAANAFEDAFRSAYGVRMGAGYFVRTGDRSYKAERYSGPSLADEYCRTWSLTPSTSLTSANSPGPVSMLRTGSSVRNHLESE